MTSTPEAYADFVDSLLAGEVTRKASIEQRAAGVISSAGALVTLLFALVALATSAKDYTLPTEAHGWLGASVGTFVLASLAAIAVSIPLPYGSTQLDTSFLASHWADPVEQTIAQLTGAKLQSLQIARRSNGMKAGLLIAASLVELVAVILLAIGVIVILHSSHG